MSGCAVGAKTVGSHTGPGTEVRDRQKEGAGTLDGQAAGWTSRRTYTGGLSWPQDDSPASPASTIQVVETPRRSLEVAPLEMAPTVGGGVLRGSQSACAKSKGEGRSLLLPRGLLLPWGQHKGQLAVTA